MTTTPQDFAARFAALPESITARCPRPLVNVTPQQVRDWFLQVRTVCLDAAASTVDVALTIARRGDTATAEDLRSEAAALLAFAREIGDVIGLPTYDTNDECAACGAHLADPHGPACPLAQD